MVKKKNWLDQYLIMNGFKNNLLDQYLTNG